MNNYSNIDISQSSFSGISTLHFDLQIFREMVRLLLKKLCTHFQNCVIVFSSNFETKHNKKYYKILMPR